jgi:GNAT superfamily N-acetyltransferase
LYQVIALTEGDLQDAARLVCERYRHLREGEPLLPDRYAEVETILPLLQDLWNASGVGVAAIRHGQLAGFLTGWQMTSFRGKRSTYSPEWANGAFLGDSARIYQAMYSQLATRWLAEGYIAHYISLFPNDVDALKAWHWLGFGMLAADALRGLEPIETPETGLQIRRAGLEDIEAVMELHGALRDYSLSSPIFLLTEKRDRSYFEAWLQDPAKVVWLASREGDPVAMMRLGPADDDVCAIVQDEKTTSIYAAYTQDGHRGTGIGTELLNRALQWAREQNYGRCAVSFEPMNPLGERFWLKHFEPVCLSLLRQVDERLAG